MVFWVIASFFNLDKKQLVKGLLNPKLILFYLFFLLTAVSAVFSENKSEAGFSVEVKLTFFFFPYLFFCFKWPPEILKRFVISFVSGCFFACLCLIARAFLYAFNGETDYFFYTRFSVFIHASYFAMYLILAIVFVTILYGDWFRTQKSVIYSSWFFVSIFVTSIFLCSSKLGLISFFITVPVVVFYKFRGSLKIKRVFFLACCLLALLLVSVKLFPGPFERFRSIGSISMENIDKTSTESTTVRILIWKESIGLIKENFLFGTGVGDANDRLREAYRKNGLTGAYRYKFNAHNQFFQTFLGLGSIGIILLLLMTFGTFFKAILKKHFLLFIFSLLIILNFMVESMLQTSAGVLFFVFFSCFFEQTNEEQLARDSSPVNIED